MRKGDDGRENGKNGGKTGKRMMKIVATNVVASRPPDRRPTATLTLVPIIGFTRSLRASYLRTYCDCVALFSLATFFWTEMF